MHVSILNYKDYREFLRTWIETYPAGRKGLKKALALACACQPAYLTRILKKDAHLSLEQAYACGPFLKLSSDEVDFFILLIQFDRAATAPLKRFFLEKMNRMLTDQLTLEKKLQSKKHIRLSEQEQYYRSWYVAVIHVMVTIPQFRTADALAHYLNLPLREIQSVLDFLQSCRLIEKKDHQYLPKKVRLHLGSSSPLIQRNHMNWRIKTLEALQNLRASEDKTLHYSSVFTASEQDLLNLKQMIVDLLQRTEKTIDVSPAHLVHCLHIDFFPI
ncbi:MAG: TIGR02147 family protein [Deltaproteobacteria bacterium]|nr:TIGR02147 family protein [Deltaproteobacteria bacterium]